MPLEAICISPAMMSNRVMPFQPSPLCCMHAVIRTMSASGHSSKREEIRAAKQLDEYRKFGLAPLAVDCVSGAEISPHIPQTLTSTPWYLENYLVARPSDSAAGGAVAPTIVNGPTLEHQRNIFAKDDTVVEDRVEKTVVINQAKKYRPGACENCGSMTHKKKECTERPRAVGAKFSNSNIAPDVVTLVMTTKSAGTVNGVKGAQTTVTVSTSASATNQDVSSFEQRRYRNTTLAGDAEYEESWKQHQAADTTGAERKRPRDEGSDDDEHERGKKVELAKAMTSTSATSTRRVGMNLPKYLINTESKTLYDASTGSMRANPNESLLKDAEASADAPLPILNSSFMGDNLSNYGGDYAAYNRAQLQLLQDERISGVLPSALELLRREEQEAIKRKAEERQAALAAVYGTTPASQ